MTENTFTLKRRSLYLFKTYNEIKTVSTKEAQPLFI